MSKVVNIEIYKSIGENATFKDRKEFWEDQEVYDSFFDYEGQIIYDDIISGKGVEQEILNSWRCNSDDAYEKWLLDK